MASSESAVTNKILGLPPRWSNHVDPGGRVFSELFLKDGFIFNVIPGTPKFNGGKFRKEKMEALEKLGRSEGIRLGLYKSEEKNDGNVDEGSWFEHGPESIEYKGVSDQFLKEKDLRFYSFYPNFADFKYVVNIIMNDLSTRLIGISFFNNGFSNYVDDSLGKIWRQGLSFYAEASSTYSESSNNTLQDSAMAGMVNNAAAATTEVAFLTGSMSRDTTERFQKNYNMNVRDQNLFQVGAEKTKDMVGKALGGAAGYALDIEGVKGVIQNGERLIFPKVWGGSSYSKSYNLNFKFFSPSGDKESILQYVYFPFICLLALSVPLQG